MINTHADLFEAAAKMMRMCDEAGIDHTWKARGILKSGRMYMDIEIEAYEFPLAIVEGKPVFVGDELYGNDGMKLIVYSSEYVNSPYGYALQVLGRWSSLSWNPPEPETVMVELLREDAEYYADQKSSINMKNLDALIDRHLEACRKALKEQTK